MKKLLLSIAVLSTLSTFVNAADLEAIKARAEARNQAIQGRTATLTGQIDTVRQGKANIDDAKARTAPLVEDLDIKATGLADEHEKAVKKHATYAGEVDALARDATKLLVQLEADSRDFKANTDKALKLIDAAEERGRITLTEKKAIFDRTNAVAALVQSSYNDINRDLGKIAAAH